MLRRILLRLAALWFARPAHADRNTRMIAAVVTRDFLSRNPAWKTRARRIAERVGKVVRPDARVAPGDFGGVLVAIGKELSMNRADREFLAGVGAAVEEAFRRGYSSGPATIRVLPAVQGIQSWSRLPAAKPKAEKVA